THNDTRVAIVVITHNRREEVLRSLEQHIRLPEQPKITVVDNGSSDGRTARRISQPRLWPISSTEAENSKTPWVRSTGISRRLTMITGDAARLRKRAPRPTCRKSNRLGKGSSSCMTVRKRRPCASTTGPWE